MVNGMTNTVAMSRNGDLYRNIDSIENKCAELISQIDDHLCVSDSRSLINRNNTGTEPVKDAVPIFQCCHQSIVDYTFTRKTTRKDVDVANLPQLRVVQEFCHQMTKINQPFSEDLLKSFLKPTASSTKGFKSAEHPSKSASKKQVAFDLNVENDPQLGFRNDGRLAVFECSHYSPTHWQNPHKCLASTKDAHAHPESVIDSQPHVQDGVRSPRNSTAADNIRAFLFGSLKKDGKIPKATKNTIVSVKTKKELRKKLKRWPEKLKMDEQSVCSKSRKKVLFKIDEPIAEPTKSRRVHDHRAATKMQNVPDAVQRSVKNQGFSENPNEKYCEEKIKLSTIQNISKIGGISGQQPFDEVTERKLATQLLKDSMKFCLKNSSRKEK